MQMFSSLYFRCFRRLSGLKGKVCFASFRNIHGFWKGTRGRVIQCQQGVWALGCAFPTCLTCPVRLGWTAFALSRAWLAKSSGQTQAAPISSVPVSHSSRIPRTQPLWGMSGILMVEVCLQLRDSQPQSNWDNSVSFLEGLLCNPFPQLARWSLPEPAWEEQRRLLTWGTEGPSSVCSLP